MANYNITWVPSSNGSAISQNIEYKKSIDSTWTIHSNVSPVTNIGSITGLDDNVIYDFRVSSVCLYGGPTPSSPFSLIKIVCPVVTLTKTFNSVSYSFPHPGGSISGFTVELLSSTSVILFTQTPTIGATMTGTFSGLTPSTAYKVRLKVTAGSFSQTCAPQDITTDNPVCDPPTSLVATVTPEEGGGT